MYIVYFCTMKLCTKCHIEKELDNFPKNKRFKSGYNSICKVCINLINKNYRENNTDLFNKTRKSHYQKNIEKHRLAKRTYYKSHKSEKSNYDKDYRNINNLKIKEYKKNWERLHKNDPTFKIKRNLRRRVHHALKGNRKADKTFNLIGCTPNFFKDYISKLMDKDMSWENYGKWHIDHIKPCFTFDLTNPEEQKKCFHYTNQRPLWAKDNLSRTKNNG